MRSRQLIGRPHAKLDRDSIVRSERDCIGSVAQAALGPLPHMASHGMQFIEGTGYQIDDARGRRTHRFVDHP